MHLNSENKLPPVDCPLIIEVFPNVLVKARRTSHVSDKYREMEYIVTPESGYKFRIVGRFRWTYP